MVELSSTIHKKGQAFALGLSVASSCMQCEKKVQSYVHKLFCAKLKTLLEKLDLTLCYDLSYAQCAIKMVTYKVDNLDFVNESTGLKK
jgi:hypothetical protein